MSRLSEFFPTLGIIGAGNMAGALLRGTVGRGELPPDHVWACDKVDGKLTELKTELGICTSGDPLKVVASVRNLVLAVKPQDMLALVDQITRVLTPDHLVISIAAGLRLSKLAGHVPAGVRLIRVMPNTPALVGEGAAALAGGPNATIRDMEATRTLLESIGRAVEIDESLMDAVTAVSGSGPAYVFRFMEIMCEAGEQMGLPADVAHSLVIQTVLGAARLAEESGEACSELRKRVTSPGGTTEAALTIFRTRDLADVIKSGMYRARDRSVELAGDD